MPDEQAAFDAARAMTAPAERITALEDYLARYPGGSRSAQASDLLLDTYLRAFPNRTEKIHALAMRRIASASPGLDRWMEEAHTADLLADAGEAGADLSSAEDWANDAVKSFTSVAYRRELVRMRARFNLPALRPRQIEHMYARDRAVCLAALANVLLRQNKPDAAVPLLKEARQLDPRSGETERLLGQYELAKGDKRQALEDLMKANALGPLPAEVRKQEEELYGELEHGDEAALERQLDVIYGGLFPQPYRLPHRQLPPGGHPVLLELFTGSDCAPCAGPDLAVDSLLQSYSRSDLIALEFDEHVPFPDPLASPDTVARAAFYGVEATPSALLDGQSVPLAGASRDDVENLVIGLADQIEEEASLPADLQLSLHLSASSTGAVEVMPSLQVSTAPAQNAANAPARTSLRTLQGARLFVALVEDNVRYQGRNGVRFHRMVARSVRELPAAAFLPGMPKPTPVLFDPEAISRAQQTYLAEYSEHNERYGRFRFSSLPAALDPNQLAIIAWVQDPASRRVLQSTFVQVPRR